MVSECQGNSVLPAQLDDDEDDDGLTKKKAAIF